jgi:hypothetical protein
MNALIDPSIVSIRGAWAALRFDDSGFEKIDGSDAGFRRSWAAMLLALPFLMLSAYAIAKLTALDPKLTDVPVSAAFIGTIVQWGAGSLSLALIAFVFGKSDRAKRLVATDNWITLWLLVLEAVPNFFIATHLLSPLGSVVAAMVGVYGLVVHARMILAVLKLPLAAVIGILIFLLLIQMSMAQLLRGFGG